MVKHETTRGGDGVRNRPLSLDLVVGGAVDDVPPTIVGDVSAVAILGFD